MDPNDRNQLDRLQSQGMIWWHAPESVGPFNGNDRRTLQPARN